MNCGTSYTEQVALAFDKLHNEVQFGRLALSPTLLQLLIKLEDRCVEVTGYATEYVENEILSIEFENGYLEGYEGGREIGYDEGFRDGLEEAAENVN